MRILIDCSATFWRPHNQTGIQRVVRELCRRASSAAPPGVTCLPVQWSLGSWRLARPGSPAPAFVRLRHFVKSAQRRRAALRRDFRAGRRHLLPLLAATAFAYPLLRLAAGVLGILEALSAPSVKILPGDTLLLAEYPYRNRSAILAAHRRGTRVVSVIYDLIPLTHPHVVGAQPAVCDWIDWLGRNSARVLSISAHVAGEIRARYRRPESEVGFFHLAADFPETQGEARRLDLPAPLFLMVGSLAPHKRHRDVLDAFELAWSRGSPAALAIVGRPGWMTDDLVARLCSHPELGRRLRWLDNASDLELAAAYRQAHALVAASEVEGFGLPVVEALLRGVPVIASDIPVFREVAGDWAEYFPMGDVAALAAAVERAAVAPRRDVSSFRWPTWDDAARRALSLASAP